MDGTAQPADARYRGRFAPSPTGPLHFGSLIAALASCCDARRHGGEWLVRIEDVDEPRSRPGADSAILRTLERHGFQWDGEVVRQSQRTALYQAALERLRRRKLTYECACTRRELAGAMVGALGEHVYQGACRQGVAPALRDRAQRAWRVRIDGLPGERIEFVDALQGPQRQHLARDVGDFVVRRADGLYAYQLAVVVDDAAQGITHIVRGADLLASTPRQIMLQRLLGFAEPAYLHVPVAINAAGEKLSKQTHARALADDRPLAALAVAWRFLDQPLPPSPPVSVAEFWSWATAHWTRRRLPPVLMLPAPSLFWAMPTPTV